jgi:hypothetical protein
MGARGSQNSESGCEGVAARNSISSTIGVLISPFSQNVNLLCVICDDFEFLPCSEQ